MFESNRFMRALCVAALCLGAQATAAPDVARASVAALPAASLYRLAVPLTDSAGLRFDWRALAGRPALVTMFYGDCNTACPITIENLRRTVAALKPGKVGIMVLMVSLDPLHDSPASLADLAARHKLDPAVFRLAVAADETHTRAMAAALQVKYRALEGGVINHTTRVSLLDGGGQLLASSTELSSDPDPAFLAQVRKAVRQP
ncbi:MAG: SCO family protein [Pseudomonadota bacterium]